MAGHPADLNSQSDGREAEEDHQHKNKTKEDEQDAHPFLQLYILYEFTTPNLVIKPIHRKINPKAHCCKEDRGNREIGEEGNEIFY